jgi:hypothetical protein
VAGRISFFPLNFKSLNQRKGNLFDVINKSKNSSMMVVILITQPGRQSKIAKPLPPPLQ